MTYKRRRPILPARKRGAEDAPPTRQDQVAFGLCGIVFSFADSVVAVSVEVLMHPGGHHTGSWLPQAGIGLPQTTHAI
jgi:hypothetical protein